jgi:hypothetical protein
MVVLRCRTSSLVRKRFSGSPLNLFDSKTDFRQTSSKVE